MMRRPWDPAQRLRWERELRDWTTDDVAARMRRLALHLGQPDPELTAHMVDAWESGSKVGPGRLALWTTILDVPVREVMALVDPLQLPEWVILAAHCGSSITWEGDTKRREFLWLLTGAMGAVDPAQLDAVLTRRLQVDRQLVGDLSASIRQLADQMAATPPALIRRAVLQHVEAARSLLARPLPPGLRRDLMAVAGHAAALAGCISSWLGEDDRARAHLSLAGRLAGGAGHAGIEALAVLWTADTLSGVQRGGDPLVEHRHVLALLDRAEDLAGPPTPPAVRAHILLRQAEEHAAAGDTAGAERYLDRADTAVSLADHDGTRYGMPPVPHVAFRGSVEILSGRPEGAVAVLEDALDRTPQVPARAAILADLGTAHARLGEIDAAVSTLMIAWEAADAAGRGDRCRRILGVRRRDLERWSADPVVRRLDELTAATGYP
jgi:hypothetical protein